ncbi:hypothetical protein [Streptomyces sp. MP131-18]|uniref:hypothetical protein n=1 Tax=Streptomyces sp. MP131-18 TaxID=1857892 RepID=UPI0009CC9951|nr:hypothetical protein STBA_27120 [Streptomyces sp. MP131-18]
MLLRDSDVARQVRTYLLDAGDAGRAAPAADPVENVHDVETVGDAAEQVAAPVDASDSFRTGAWPCPYAAGHDTTH